MHTEALPIPPAVTALISRTIDRLRHLQVQPDPIVPAQHRQRYGILTSAVRADGQILEMAISEALKALPHLRLVRTPPIFIPPLVDQIVGGVASAETLRSSHLHYEGDQGRKVAPDLVLIDANRKAIDFLEVKRGLARTDAGKTRQTIRDLRCLQLVGKSYALRQLNAEVDTATAAVCAIHGATAVPADLQVAVEDLEVRYGLSLRAVISATYTEFGRQLDELLFQQALDEEIESLYPERLQEGAPVSPLIGFAEQEPGMGDTITPA
ncbi:MAG: hypothetical protein PW843_27415 [Azospirillaceae bacterium]|nr:hypothetical protein [Azospirillaceae bacterium]